MSVTRHITVRELCEKFDLPEGTVLEQVALTQTTVGSLDRARFGDRVWARAYPPLNPAMTEEQAQEILLGPPQEPRTVTVPNWVWVVAQRIRVDTDAVSDDDRRVKSLSERDGRIAMIIMNVLAQNAHIPYHWPGDFKA